MGTRDVKEDKSRGIGENICVYGGSGREPDATSRWETGMRGGILSSVSFNGEMGVQEACCREDQK